MAQNPPLFYRPAPDRAPSPAGRPTAAVLTLVALGRRGLATGLAVVASLNGIVMGGRGAYLVVWVGSHG